MFHTEVGRAEKVGVKGVGGRLQIHACSEIEISESDFSDEAS